MDEVDEVALAQAMRTVTVTVMAKGTDAETVLRVSRDIADEVIARGWC